MTHDPWCLFGLFMQGSHPDTVMTLCPAHPFNLILPHSIIPTETTWNRGDNAVFVYLGVQPVIRNWYFFNTSLRDCFGFDFYRKGKFGR